MDHRTAACPIQIMDVSSIVFDYMTSSAVVFKQYAHILKLY